MRPCLTFCCGDETEWPAVCDSKNVNTPSRDRYQQTLPIVNQWPPADEAP